MTLLLTGVLILIGTFVAVISVGSLNPEIERNEIFYSQLQALKSRQSAHSVQRKIADINWQLNNLSATEKIWYDEWLQMSANWKTSGHKDFSIIAQNLSGVYMDHGNFDQALKIYELAIDYDKKLYGENSKEVARDLNNSALCLYLKGTASSERSERTKYFQFALKRFEASNVLWTKLNNKQSEFNIENNNKLQSLVQRDLAG